MMTDWVTDKMKLIPRPITEDGDRLSQGHCPDCGYRGFVLGPLGGAAQNIECGNIQCRARFNVTVYAGQVLFAQRIEKQSEGGPSWPSDPDLYAGIVQ